MILKQFPAFEGVDSVFFKRDVLRKDSRCMGRRLKTEGKTEKVFPSAFYLYLYFPFSI
jgi:hypothetical protein